MTKGRSTSKQESIYAQSFEIIPAEVVFKDIEVNQYYEITVEIRNLTNRSKRIRFQKP
jgi:ribonucleotide reductase beta subunit family protein with ferritin-like domain